jgi:demethylmenaquinone methyltransferase/2-methoxy-6-polyprenyl-1,4-benzoquinol methylase
MFETIAPTYDLLNDLLSGGLHRLWKRQALCWLRPRAGRRMLDLCCGTGDLAILMAARVRPAGVVLGIDAAAAPLRIARRRGARLPWLPLSWRQGDVLATGLPSGWADGAAMAFGLRNLPDPGLALAELHRVLRPAARAAILDFNRPAPGSLQAVFQRWYLRRVVVPTAARFALADHYAYLEASLARFPPAREQVAIARQAGFSSAQHRPLAGGLMGMLELVA